MSELANLTDDELCSQWRASPRQHSEEDWQAAFRRRRIGKRPTGTITAYRGAKNDDGMSWADERPAAQVYARINRSPLWSTKLRPSAIVAVIDHPGYAEYVVDPDRLGTVRQIAEAPPRKQAAGRQPRERGRTIFAAKMQQHRSERRTSRSRGRDYR